MEYAVVDVETTGLYPGGHDRIVEIAVVRLRSDLTVSRAFSTLVNPKRDIGPTWLHGLRTADILDAPVFEDIAGVVIEHLEDAVIVGHNVTFDLRFLEAEFARAGAPIERPPYVDTMSVSVQLGSPSRNLRDACELFGIRAEDEHSALADARTTAELFVRCVQRLGLDRADVLVRRTAESRSTSWPTLRARRSPWPRARAATRRREEIPFLATLVRDLPVVATDAGDWHAYYALLDRALRIGGISYRSVNSILQSGLDQIPLEEQGSLALPQDHEHVRGRTYYAFLTDDTHGAIEC